jgi:hypothetical protein
MSRIYHTRFTRSGWLLREGAVGGRTSHRAASTPIQIQGDAARGRVITVHAQARKPI